MKYPHIAMFMLSALVGGLAFAWHHERAQQRTREAAFALELESLKAEVEARQQQLAVRTPPLVGTLLPREPLPDPFLSGLTPHERRLWVGSSDWDFHDSTRSVDQPTNRFHSGDFPTDLERRRLIVPAGGYIPAGPPKIVP